MPDIQWVLDLLESDGADQVIQYGSSIENPADANDVDFVAVYEDSRPRENFEFGDWDITRLTTDQLLSYQERLDPVYLTEPILTGELIYGDEIWYEELKTAVGTATPDSQAVDHNFREAVSEFQRAQQLLQQSHLTWAAESLTFSISHWAFARRYARGNAPAPIDQVVEDSPYTEFYIEARKAMKADSSNISSADIQTLLHSWRQSLLFDD